MQGYLPTGVLRSPRNSRAAGEDSILVFVSP